MVMTIKSIKRKKGTYEGRDYDNIEVSGFVQNSANEQVICGEEIEVCKFKAGAFVEALDRNITALNSPNVKDIKSLYGLLFSPVYNKFGNCDDFSLAIPDGLFAPDSFPNEATPEKADKKK